MKLGNPPEDYATTNVPPDFLGDIFESIAGAVYKDSNYSMKTFRTVMTPFLNYTFGKNNSFENLQVNLLTFLTISQRKVWIFRSHKENQKKVLKSKNQNRQFVISVKILVFLKSHENYRKFQEDHEYLIWFKYSLTVGLSLTSGPLP